MFVSGRSKSSRGPSGRSVGHAGPKERRERSEGVTDHGVWAVKEADHLFERVHRVFVSRVVLMGEEKKKGKEGESRV